MIVLRLRPDHEVMMAYVVDYKTGEKRPEHRTQIAAYRDAFNALGHVKVEGNAVVYGGWGGYWGLVLRPIHK